MEKSNWPVISVKDVTKSFGGKEILTGITLEIFEGDRVGLMGKAGSGKTTLLNIMYGLNGYKPDTGDVVFHVSHCPKCSWVDFHTSVECPICASTPETVDFDIWKGNDRHLKRAIRTRLGILHQKSFGVYGNLTAFENIVGAINEAGFEREESYGKAAEILELVNLMHRSSHLANDLSGGEKQRLVLARQLAQNPMILFADDPTGSLDPVNAKLISDTLSSIRKPTVLMITSHIPAIIDSICSRAVLLDQGKVVETGAPTEITAKMQDGNQHNIDEDIPFATQPIIKLAGVSKIYHKVTSGVVKAVDGVDLTILEGSIIGLVGKSGAGKTTLSKIIAGVLSPTQGTVHVRVGNDWISLLQPGESGRGRATRYISILYQEYALYSSLSVFENLAKSKELNIPDEFVRMKAMHTLKRLGFSENHVNEIMMRRTEDLSEGERHRVALAWALMRDPKILILDEPSGTMDRVTKGEVGVALRSLRNEFGTTIIIVSHDVEFSLNTCDNLALMEGGKITTIGSPDEVVEALEGVSALYPNAKMPALGEPTPDSMDTRYELL